jgi:hypothetical protein
MINKSSNKEVIGHLAPFLYLALVLQLVLDVQGKPGRRLLAPVEPCGHLAVFYPRVIGLLSLPECHFEAPQRIVPSTAGAILASG